MGESAMQRQFVSYSGVWRVRLERIVWSVAFTIMACLLAGCVDPGAQLTYSVSDTGVLTLKSFSVPVTVTPMEHSGNHTTSRVVFHTPSGDVYAVFVTPDNPRAAFIFAPGAGVKKEWHLERGVRYAEAGYAFLIIDPRGNGGETQGYRFSLEEDYRQFSRDEWPQYYEIAGDLITARMFLEEESDIPVFFIGDSDGGRVAAIATASDSQAAGYIGVSTSGFGMIGNQYIGDPRRFLLSVDPEAAIGRIAPRPVWIFHARGDTIIPFIEGQRLFNAAHEPKRFMSFNGTHGSNDEVDRIIINEFIPSYFNISQ